MNLLFSGFGNIPPVRRWENGGRGSGRGSSCPSCQNTNTVQAGQQRAMSRFFAPVPGSTLDAPQRNLPTPQSALSGLGWKYGGCSDEDIVNLRNDISFRLDRLSPGIKVTAQSLLNSTDAGGTCDANKKILQQALDMAINDLRAQAEKPAKTAEEIANRIPAQAALKELEALAPMADTTKYLIAGGVALGVIVLLGGGAALLSRLK